MGNTLSPAARPAPARPQLRNLYTKVGMFGAAINSSAHGGSTVSLGSQVRGFGFTNDGSVDALFNFLTAKVFDSNSAGRVGFFGGDPQRRDVESYLLAFDSDLAPVVGQQVTLDSTNAAVVGQRLDLMVARAQTPFSSGLLGPAVTECDLVATGVVSGRTAAFALQTRGANLGLFARDDGDGTLTDAGLRALAQVPGQAPPPPWPAGPETAVSFYIWLPSSKVSPARSSRVSAPPARSRSGASTSRGRATPSTRWPALR